MTSVVFRSLLIAAPFILAGCGSSGPAIVPVNGTVKLDGQPVANANVMFVPATGKPAYGLTDEQGKFSLTTTTSNDGAAEGEYRVGVVGVRTTGVVVGEDGTSSDVSKARQEWFVPQRYSQAESSGLQQSVKKGMGPVELNLSSK